MLTTYPLFHQVSRAVGPSSDREADRTWSASVASPSDGGHRAGDGAPGSPAGGLHGCGRTAQGTPGTLRTRQLVQIGEKGTTPNLSFRSEFSGTTGDDGEVGIIRSPLRAIVLPDPPVSPRNGRSAACRKFNRGS